VAVLGKSDYGGVAVAFNFDPESNKVWGFTSVQQFSRGPLSVQQQVIVFAQALAATLGLFLSESEFKEITDWEMKTGNSLSETNKLYKETRTFKKANCTSTWEIQQEG